jgi:hypothetical protein
LQCTIIGIRRKNGEEAEKNRTKQNTAVLVSFRAIYLFDVSQTEGADLPELREISGKRWREPRSSHCLH